MRRIAESLLQEIAESETIFEAERGDLATSLVRQWITYDSKATLFIGEQQIYLALAKNVAGGIGILREAFRHGWTNTLTQDWKIDPEEFPDIFGQLNRGQSAEVINSEGIPLRLWVNPKERTNGVEPLVKQPVPPGTKRDYHKIAGDQLEHLFGSDLDADEMEELVCSVAKQWQQYEGHACLFFDGARQICFTLTEKGDGCCTVSVKKEGINLDPLLTSFGFAPEIIRGVIARINLGQEVEFHDGKGTPSVLWHDPKTRRIHVRATNPTPPVAQTEIPPTHCSFCHTALIPSVENTPKQTCPICGQSIPLP